MSPIRGCHWWRPRLRRSPRAGLYEPLVLRRPTAKAADGIEDLLVPVVRGGWHHRCVVGSESGRGVQVDSSQTLEGGVPVLADEGIHNVDHGVGDVLVADLTSCWVINALPCDPEALELLDSLHQIGGMWMSPIIAAALKISAARQLYGAVAVRSKAWVRYFARPVPANVLSRSMVPGDAN